jgi:uncharacterized protein YkwD
MISTLRFICVVLIMACANATVSLGNDLFRRVASMVSDERQKIGLSRLEYDERLQKAALSQARWMAQVRKMEHLRGEKPKEFGDYLRSDHHHATRILKTGYVRWQDLFDVRDENGRKQVSAKPDADDHVSEIIAFAGPNTGTVPQQLPVVVPGWMRSPGHRAVIVKPGWQHVGAAFAAARHGSTYYCVTFGKPVE